MYELATSLLETAPKLHKCLQVSWAVVLTVAGLARVSVVSWQVSWGLEGLGWLHSCVQHWDVCSLEQ